MRDNFIRHSVAVTPSDTVDLTSPGRGLYVGVSGNIKIMYEDGTTDTFTNLADGMWHPMEITRVYSTGTTATDIHVGW